MIIKWSQSDIEYIKANFQNTKYKDLAAKFGTTTDSIKKLIRLRLNLSKPKRWTDEQIDILKKEYRNTTSKDLAIKLEKEATVINQMANRLGLKKFEKMPDWSEEEIKTLKDIFPKKGQLLYWPFFIRNNHKNNVLIFFI